MGKDKVKSRGSVGTQKAAYFFLLPSLLILTVFVFFPLISALAISLTNMDVFMSKISFTGMSNFKQAMGDSRFWNATGNTLYFAALEVPLQIILSLLIAAFVARNTRFCKMLRSIYYIPFVCSMTAIGIVWSMLLDPNMGLIPYCLKFLGVGTISFLKDPALAMPTLVVITAWKGFGYTLTLMSAAMLDISGSLYEAADIDGAGYWQKFCHITIPGIWPTISFCIVTNTIGSLQVFDQAYVMTKGGPLYHTETLVQYIYNRGFQTAPYSLGYASAISVLLLIIVAVITFVLRKFVLQREEE